MAKMQKKSLDSPDETRSFDKGKIELANFADITIGRGILNQDGVGKNVSNHLSKPIAAKPHIHSI